MNSLMLFGDIGWDVQPSQVLAELAGMSGDVLVRVNSYGGDIYDGISIMHALRSHDGRVTVRVEGVAASAASLIAVGGADELHMTAGSELMVHMPWVETPGNSDDLRKAADDLDRTAVSMAEIYAEKAGGTAEQWVEMMRAETWFSAQEAVDAGLADAVADSRAGKVPVLAGASRKRFAFAGRSEAPTPKILEEEKMTFTNEVAKRLGLTATDVDEETVLAALEETLSEQAGEPDGDDVQGDDVETEPDVVEESDVVDPEGEPAEFAEEPDQEDGDADVEDSAASVTLPRDVFEELKAAAEAGAAALAAERERSLDAEVDSWISEGRAVAAKRASIREDMRTNPEATRRIYANVPKGTIPRVEIGYGVDPVEPESDSTPSVDDLRKLAKSRLEASRK